MALPYGKSALLRLVDQNFAYPKSSPISALEARQVLYALLDSVPLLAEGGFQTKIVTWAPTPPAVANTFAKDTPVLWQGNLYLAKYAIFDSRQAPGTYDGWQQDWLLLSLGGDSEGGGEDIITITGITEFPDQFGNSFTGTTQEFAEKLLKKYQVPGFSLFALDGANSRTVEVGTSFPAGFKTVRWSTTNGGNVQANSIALRDLTANTTLASGEPNDGTLSASTAAFTAVRGRSRAYLLSGLNSKGDAFYQELDIDGAYRVFYGESSPTSGAQVRALPGSFLETQATSFTLNTDTAQNQFSFFLPPGKTVVSVIDQDALNKDITAEYVASGQGVPDAGGSAVSYTAYRKQQAVPYDTSHRHFVTFR